MAINQVQLRLSIDGQQALSTIDALGIKQADLMQSTKAMTEARTQDMKSWKDGLAEISKWQEKQILLEKQMAAARTSGNHPLLSKLELQHEGNSDKINELIATTNNYNEAIHLNDLAILTNTKAIKANNTELEKLYISEGRTLVAEAKLVAEKRALTREAMLAGNGSDRQRIANEKLAAVEKELTQRTLDRAKASVSGMQKVIKEQGIEKVSTQDLITLTKALETAQRHRTDRASEDAQEEIKSIKEVNAELAKRKEETAPDAEGFSMGGMMKGLKGGLGSAVIGGMAGALTGGIMMAVTATLEKIGEAISATIDRIALKATQITAIQTSMDITRLKAREINQSLNDIDTKTSVAELNNLVEVAGSLNVPLEKLNTFVKEGDKVGIVLGKAFGGTSEAVTQIAKLKGEFKDTRDLGIDESLTKIGSVLKALDLAGPASVSGITDFLKRAGNIPDALKPGIASLAAWGSIFEQANLSSEISASSMGKILLEATNNLSLFGKQLGVSANYVKTLINQDPDAFLQKFAKSLQGLNGTELGQTLKTLNLEGSETLKTVGVMTASLDNYRETLNLANDELQRSNTLNRIANTINNDEAAKIEKISKSWDKLKNSLSSWAALLVGPVINALANTTKKAEDLTDAYEKQQKRATNLETAITPILEKYHTLSEEAKNGAKNQNLLNIEIGKIGKIFPEAITGYDDYNRAISFNLGLVEQAIQKEKELALAKKNTAVREINTKNYALVDERTEINKKLREYVELNARLQIQDKKIVNDYERMFLQKRADKLGSQVPDLQKRNQEIITEINKNVELGKKFGTEVAIKPPDDGTDNGKNLDLSKGGKKSDGNKTENDRKRKEKYEQTQRDNMIELQAKLAFEEKMAVADDEQKKILQAEKKAKDELHQVRTQFKDIDGLVIKHADLSEKQQQVIDREVILIKKRLAEEKINIEREYLKKQDDVYEAHANKAIQIANDAAREELQKNLNNAKRKGERLGIFNAEERIINNDEATDTFSENVKYLKEQEAAKDNAAALILIEENHRKAIELIQIKYRNRRDAHIADANEKEKDIAEKNTLNSLGLNVKEDEQSGKNPLQSKIAVLDAQKALEIANADKTGASIADIERKYRLERAALEGEDARTRAGKAIQHFQQAFNAVANIGRAILESKSIDEEQRYNDSIRRIDQQAERGILTARQQTKQKMALDKEYDKAQRKIKLEQFNLDKAANIANIIMQTALAVMSASVKGFWSIAPIVALGAIELGIAASQKAPAYFDGGPLPDYVSNPVDNKGGFKMIGHPGEFMVSKAKRQTPLFAAIEPILMKMDKNGNYGGSYYDGGPLLGSSNPTSPISLGGLTQSDVREFTKAVGDFKEHVISFSENVKTPLTAHAAIGEEEIYKMEQERNKLTKKLNDSYVKTNQSLIQ